MGNFYAILGHTERLLKSLSHAVYTQQTQRDKTGRDQSEWSQRSGEVTREREGSVVGGSKEEKTSEK